MSDQVRAENTVKRNSDVPQIRTAGDAVKFAGAAAADAAANAALKMSLEAADIKNNDKTGAGSSTRDAKQFIDAAKDAANATDSHNPASPQLLRDGAAKINRLDHDKTIIDSAKAYLPNCEIKH